MLASGLLIAGAVVCAVSVLVAVVATFARDYPDDIAILGVAAVELFLIVYGVTAGIRQAGGDPVSGELWEFWGYLLTALLIPVLAFWWAVTDKTRWSNLVLAAVGATVFVMLFRMEQIWHGGVLA
ncbi:hypothetical protein GCM10022377_12230 [Zhihengliuella alba]|uniref:Integral membrane protein n=1 Tax=Zhihengliuella alba TaxID=547018 RepID=A0ABP7D4B5_9MICC